MSGYFQRGKKKQEQGLFLTSSKAWKLSSTTECFLSCCQQGWILGTFLKRECEGPIIFVKGVPAQKRLEPML